MLEKIYDTSEAFQKWYQKLLATIFRRVLKPFSRNSRKIFESKKIKRAYGVLVLSVMVSSAIFPTTLLAVQSDQAKESPAPQVITVSVITEKSIRVPLESFTLSQTFGIFHPGVDLAASVGTPVYPVMDGTVAEVIRERTGYGNHILINHGSGLSSLYAHLSTIAVKEGDTVTRMTKIGGVGSTGRSTGPHLHLQVHQNDEWINPLKFMEDYLGDKIQVAAKVNSVKDQPKVKLASNKTAEKAEAKAVSYELPSF